MHSDESKPVKDYNNDIGGGLSSEAGTLIKTKHSSEKISYSLDNNLTTQLLLNKQQKSNNGNTIVSQQSLGSSTIRQTQTSINSDDQVENEV